MNIKIYHTWLGLMVLLAMLSCKKWTDVKPTIEVRGELIFSSEATVQEALNGVYSRMGQAAGYGCNMTWGFVDAMGGVYNTARLQDFEVEASTGKFDNILTAGVIEQLWNNTYNAIANDNNLISGIDQADPSIFNGNNKDLMKGEALALRAMLHFDMLRLFGPTVNSSAWNQPILPYVTVYSSNITPRINGPEIITKLLADLAQAEELLKKDPILSTVVVNELRARKVRLNYYAVKALQARLYLWLGDKPKALEAAKVIIDAVPQKFSWTSVSDINSSVSYDYVFASENIFSLYVSNLSSYIEGKMVNIPYDLTTNNFLPHYGTTEALRQEIYEAAGVGVTDFRSIYMMGTYIYSGSTTMLYKKLHQTDGGANRKARDYAERRIPMLKTSEMFYIAAECTADTDPAQAVGYLNTVRTNRGLVTDLSTNLTTEQVRQEIRKEYRKEFPAEGQFFYYRKRTGEMNYALPLPQREIEYGL